MEDDSDTKEIANRSILCLEVFKVYNFRSDVSRSSTPHEHVVLSCILGKSKVSNHAVEIPLLPQEYVLGFQVPMHDVISVHDFEPFQDALHHYFDFLRSELVLRLYFVIELSSLKQFD